MNDLVKQFLGDKAPELIKMLTSKLGIGDGEAEGFLGTVIEKVTSMFSGGDFDVSKLLGGGDATSLLKDLDLGELASKSGLTGDQAKQGLEAITPALTEKLGPSGDLKDMLGGLLGGGGGDAKDLLGGLGKMFGS